MFPEMMLLMVVFTLFQLSVSPSWNVTALRPSGMSSTYRPLNLVRTACVVLRRRRNDAQKR